MPEYSLPPHAIRTLDLFNPLFIGDLSGIIDTPLPKASDSRSLDEVIDYTAIMRQGGSRTGVTALHSYLVATNVGVQTYGDLLEHTQKIMQLRTRVNWQTPSQKQVRNPYCAKLVGAGTLSALYIHCDERKVYLFGNEYTEKELSQ